MRLYHARFRMHQAARWLNGESVPQAMPSAMYDGINADAAWIAAHFPKAPYVGGYDTSQFAWTAAEWALFSKATKQIHIVTNATVNDGDVLDWENGNENQGSPHGWIKMRHSAGYLRPTIYCNEETLASVRANTGSLLLGQDYDVWIANWTGAPHAVKFTTSGKGSGVVNGVYTSPAVQYLGGADNDRDDRSAVYDSAWPYRTAPKPPPAPQQTPGTASGPARYGSGYRWVADGSMSMGTFAAKRGSMVLGLLAVSSANLNTKNRDALNAYVSGPLGVNAVMPRGLVFYTVNS